MVGIDKRVAILAVLGGALCAAAKAQAGMIVVWGNDKYGTVSGAPAGTDFKAIAGVYAGGAGVACRRSFLDSGLPVVKRSGPRGRWASIA